MIVRWTWMLPSTLLLTLSVFSTTVATAQDAVADTAGDDAKPKTIAPTLEENPLLTEPRTADTLFDAVVLMSDLARPNLARMYFVKLVESNPDEATLLKLRDKHGPSIFLRLANDKNLQPESVTLLEQVNAAFRKGAMDPVRIDRLIADLGKSAAEREVAILQLRNAGSFAAARVLSVLNSTRNDDQKKLLLYTLTRLNREVIPVVLGAVEAPNPDLRASAIEALGWMADREVAIALWHPAFAESQPAAVQLAAKQSLARLLYGSVNRVSDVKSIGAAPLLAKSARQHLRQQVELPRNDDGQVERWSWDEEAATVVMTAISAETASIEIGTRQAREAFQLATQRADLSALYWTALMATELHESGRGAAVQTGPDSTFQLGLKLGPEIMQLALTEAMSANQPAVATTVLQVLAQTGSAHMLKYVEGRPAPVLAALNHPDPRVQSAAASTILIWDPQTSFRGSSRVVEVLTRSLLDSGKARGIAIDANEQRATSMSSALKDMGFEADMAQTGQDGFKQAIERGDVALFLIEANVARWELSQTLANLRADARTAYIPIVIYGDDRLRTRVERAAASYSRVEFVTQVSSGEDMKRQVAPFLKRWQADSMTQPQRTAQRKSALFWLTQLADRRQANRFDLTPAENALFNAVNDADLAESAIFSLGAIGTPSAQSKLFEIAITASRPIAVRERALAQLTGHIQHHGVLLTEIQTAELNKAARQEVDPKLQTAFAATLGALHPDLRQANELLNAVPARRANSPKQ